MRLARMAVSVFAGLHRGGRDEVGGLAFSLAAQNRGRGASDVVDDEDGDDVLFAPS